MKKCLIIGAGMSGLLAGTFLQENNIDVTILDKGRGVGGRMATRRLAGGRADHGAQFFTVRNPTFGRWVEEWLQAGVVVEWARGFDRREDGHPRYRGRDGMTAVPKYLARLLDVRTGVRAAAIFPPTGDRGWRVDTAGEAFFADALLLTAPVPQSLALLDGGAVELPGADRRALEEIRYDPCFAVLAVLERESGVPDPGAVQIKGEPIAWIADNRQKGISARPVVTIHAGPEFSRDHLEADRDWIADQLLWEAEAAGWLDRQAVVEIQVQRWLFAQPVSYYPRRFLLLPVDEGSGYPLAFAGDAFGESRVEGAALSGLGAAEALLDALR